MSALVYFRDQCFDDVKDKLRNGLIEQITKDRNGEYADWDLLKRAIGVYVQLGFINAEIIKQDDDYVWKGDKNLHIYEMHFEKPLLAHSEKEYLNKATGWMSNCNCPEYLREIDKHLRKEEERADYFLQPETKDRLLNVIHKKIIEDQAQHLVDKDTGCEAMFQHKKLDELELMYQIFLRVDSTIKFIIAKMNPYIEERGNKIINDDALLKDPLQFTSKLLDLKKEMDEMVELSFKNDIRFQKNIDMSFQTFMNNCQFTPHYIASYCDNEFKKGLKGLSDADIEIRLEAIIRLFCCLHSKDVFIKSYTKFLA